MNLNRIRSIRTNHTIKALAKTEFPIPVVSGFTLSKLAYIHHHHHDVAPPARISLTSSIVHCSWKVYNATSCIGTELLYIVSCWSSYLFSSLRRGPQEYVPYVACEFIITSPHVRFV